MISRGYKDPEPSGTWGVLNSGINLSKTFPAGGSICDPLCGKPSCPPFPYCSYSIAPPGVEVNQNIVFFESFFILFFGKIMVDIWFERWYTV
jgi:hypothetical protein